MARNPVVYYSATGKAQHAAFLDPAGELWQRGECASKVATSFTTAQTELGRDPLVPHELVTLCDTCHSPITAFVRAMGVVSVAGWFWGAATCG